MLLRVLRKMKAVHGDVYAFHPDSYVLPTEYTKFINAFTRLQPVGTDRIESSATDHKYTYIFLLWAPCFM